MQVQDWFLLITLSVLWGGSFFFVELVVNDFPPVTIVAIRVGLASLVLLGFCMVTGREIRQLVQNWKAFFGMSLLNNVIPFTLIVWGQTQISSSLASVLNATTPIFTVVVAHFLSSDEKLDFTKLTGVIVGFIGVVILLFSKFELNLDGILLGQVAVLGAAISYSFASVFGRRFGRIGIDPVVTATGQLLGSSVILIPIAISMDSQWRSEFLDIDSVLALVGLAVLSTALAYILYFKLLKSAGATNLMLVTFLIPVSATLLGVLVLNEILTLNQILGMLVLLAGLLIIDGRLLKFRKC